VGGEADDDELDDHRGDERRCEEQDRRLQRREAVEDGDETVYHGSTRMSAVIKVLGRRAVSSTPWPCPFL